MILHRAGHTLVLVRLVSHINSQLRYNYSWIMLQFKFIQLHTSNLGLQVDSYIKSLVLKIGSEKLNV